MVGLVSAAGLVGFLSEPDTELQVFALQSANEEIGLLWTEFAGAIGQIEALYEDKSFPERELAALVAAKIFYHLQAYDESMAFALGAGKLFDVEREGEFEDTIIAKCIDTYISLSAIENAQASFEDSDKQDPSDELNSAFLSGENGAANTTASLTTPITPFSQSTLPSKSLLSSDEHSYDASRELPTSAVLGPHASPRTLPPETRKALQGVIRRIFERCFEAGSYRQVVGIAVEARNLDVLRETIARASDQVDPSGKSKSRDKSGRREELMDYLLDICMNVIQERSLRNQILELILDLLVSQEDSSPDYFSIAKCLVYLGQASMTSDILRRLVEKDDSKSLVVAFQISFDLYDNGTQEFLTDVIKDLPLANDPQLEFAGANGHAVQPNTLGQSRDLHQPTSETSNQTTVVTRAKSPNLTDQHKKAYTSIRDILQGTKSLELELEFLYRANKADRTILTRMIGWLEARNSIFHSAVTFANAFMNSGTTSDWFIRKNLEWLNKAVNWSKFSVTASLGVIHRGNISQGQKLLEPYLRESNSGGASSIYSRGGALYALGLICTNHGQHVLDYLHTQLKNSTNEEVVQHGAALGLGVAGMATANEEIADELKSALFSDSAISGQAAGLAIGLVMLGSGNIKALSDMLTYAHETEHEKTVRGLALGMALIMYARQEAADEMISGLLDDPDPTIRYGGIMTIALAYCGTSSNKAIRKLLHVAVSDVNDDVRRTAVMSLGFVLFRKPSSVPRMVELLAESYNPHVRYGATMALGIACAGTGLEEAVDLLEPMMKDSTDFVRQGAFIALSMIMVQQSEAMSSKVSSTRKHLQKVMGDKHEDAMAKFGGALALGIIDAGGRNCTIGLQTQTGNLNMAAIVGMAVFTQYWYWFPLTHFISLSFTPTTVIAVDQDLEVPKFSLYCAARPSYFGYPPAMEVKTEEAPEKVKTAVLSTTAQAQRRKQAKERQQRRSSMDVDQPAPATPKPSADGDKMDVDEDAIKDDGNVVKTSKEEDMSSNTGKSSTTKVSRVEKEKIGFELENMSRVLPEQLKYMSFPSDTRYTPVKKPTGGVVLVVDTQPSEPKILIERQIKPAPRATSDSANTVSTTIPTPATPEHSRTVNSAADAASILTAVDEDEDPMEEAHLPEDFDYFSDGEDGSEE